MSRYLSRCNDWELTMHLAREIYHSLDSGQDQEYHHALAHEIADTLWRDDHYAWLYDLVRNSVAESGLNGARYPNNLRVQISDEDLIGDGDMQVITQVQGGGWYLLDDNSLVHHNQIVPASFMCNIDKLDPENKLLVGSHVVINDFSSEHTPIYFLFAGMIDRHTPLCLWWTPKYQSGIVSSSHWNSTKIIEEFGLKIQTFFEERYEERKAFQKSRHSA